MLTGQTSLPGLVGRMSVGAGIRSSQTGATTAAVASSGLGANVRGLRYRITLVHCLRSAGFPPDPALIHRISVPIRFCTLLSEACISCSADWEIFVRLSPDRSDIVASFAEVASHRVYRCNIMEHKRMWHVRLEHRRFQLC